MRKNKKRLSRSVLIGIFLLIVVTGCSAQSTVKQDDIVLVSSDESRDFFYLPDSIEQRMEEGDDIVSLRVQMVHNSDRGFLGQEEQLWHIDYRNERYKVTESYAFDVDGNYRQT